MKFLIMRRRYTHTNPINPFRIRNRFSHNSSLNEINETTTPNDAAAIRSPVRPDNDDYMDFQYNYEDDNESIHFQDNEEEEENNDEDYFRDNEKEEESNNEDYFRDDEEEEENNNEDYFRDNEEEEEENNNEDYFQNNEVEEESNNEDNEEKEEDNNEEKRGYQIIEALDKNKIPSCNGDFAPYFDNYTTAALFCWLLKHNISINAYEDLVSIIHNSRFEPTHVVKNI